MPLGWGPYQVVEWAGGDHITLQKNPFYFRSAEGWPAFDFLTFRFVGSGAEAVEALLAGECDLVDPNALQDVPLANLADLQQQGALKMVTQPKTRPGSRSPLGSVSLDDQRPRFFAFGGSAPGSRAVPRPAGAGRPALWLGGRRLPRLTCRRATRSTTPRPLRRLTTRQGQMSCWDRRAGWTWTITPRPRALRRERRGCRTMSFSR